MRSIFTRCYERLWVRNGRKSSFFLGNRWPQTWFYAAPKIYVAGPIQGHRVLTRSTGCRQQASGKFISRKNEKLLDKRHALERWAPFPYECVAAESARLESVGRQWYAGARAIHASMPDKACTGE